MAGFDPINLGSVADDRTGDTFRAGGTKLNAMLDELFTTVNAAGIVFINQLSDFPVQDATTITLEAGKFYWLTAPITTSKRFDVQNNATLTAGSQSSSALLTYTGTGAMFTLVDSSFTLTRMRYDHPNGRGFDVTDNAPGVNFVFLEQIFGLSGTSIGTFHNLGAFVLDRSTIIAVEGMSFSGASFGIFAASLTAIVTSSATTACIDLDGAICNTLKLSDLILNYATGGFGISGLTNSGNLPVGRLAMVTNCEFSDDLTPLENITTSDVRWEFIGNASLPDSVNEADVYLTGGAETITTGSAGDWQEIGVPSAGGVSWSSDIASRFTVGTDGVITYIGERDLFVRVSGRATIEKVGGGSNILEVRLAKNWDGTASDSGIEKSRAQTENTAATTVPIGALINFSTGDDVRVIFSNTDGSSNIIANVSAMEIA